MKSGTDSDSALLTANPFSIMYEIAKGVYLDDIMLGKPNTLERLEVNMMLFIIHR